MNAETIIEAVLTVWNRRYDQAVTMEDVKSRTRVNSVQQCRLLSVFCIRRMTRKTTIDIGKIFSRDHSTVVHSCKVIQGRIDMGFEEAQIVSEVVGLLGDIEDTDGVVENPAQRSLLRMYKAARRRANELDLELITLRGKVSEQRKEMAELRKLNDLLNEKLYGSQYVQPKNWTKEERRKLAEWRSQGIGAKQFGKSSGMRTDAPKVNISGDRNFAR